MPLAISSETALSLIATCGLSQDDYQTIRNVTKAHNADIFPTYHEILEAKKKCYPDKIEISESKAQQPLQDLLDHTAKRLIMIDAVKESICGEIKPSADNANLVVDLRLCCKWGFDGATGQSHYKQRFSDDSTDDRSLFSVMLVPLDLNNGTVTNE
jgi:hypothetical protein